MNTNVADKPPKLRLSLALAAGLALAGCGDSALTDAEHIAKAKDFLDHGNDRGGLIELKNALQKNPDNAEARRLLGEVEARLGDGPAAEKELRQAIALGVQPEAVALPLAEALLSQGKYQAILDQPAPGPNLAKDQRAKLAAYRGDAWSGLNKLDKARAEYEAALALDPSAPLAKLGLARLALAYNDPGKAEQLLKEALEAAPNEARLWSFQGDYDRAKGDLEKAEIAYTQAIGLRHQNTADRANRALVRIDLGKLDAAEEDTKALQAQARDYFLGHHAAGLLALARHDYPNAQAEFEQAINLNPRYLPTLYYLGHAHLMQNHLAQADSALSQFLAGFPSSAGALRMMAAIKVKQGEFDAARKYAEPILKYAPRDPGANQLMGLIELAKGDRDGAIKLLDKAVELDPKSASAQLSLGMTLLSQGDNEKGAKALEAAIGLDPGRTEPWVYLALLQIQQGWFDKAGETLAAMKAKSPDSPLPLDLEGALLTAKGEKDRAAEAFRAAWAKAPGDPMAGLNLAQMALAANQPDEARALYGKILAAHPDDLLTHLKRVELEGAQGKYADAETQLKELVKRFPDAAQPRVLLARHLSHYGKAAQALPLLQEVAAKHGGDPVFMEAYAQALLDNKEAKRALEAGLALERLAPNSAAAHLLLARAYAENNDAQRTRAALDRALALDPKSLPARVMHIRLQILEKPDAAASEMEQLKRDFPDNAEVLSLAGWLALQQNRPGEAAQAYRAAFGKQPTTSAATSLAQAEWFAGQRDAAQKTLGEWLGQHPQDVTALVMRAGMLSQSGNAAAARGDLETALKADPGSALVLNELAWLLRESAPAAALGYAERAYQVAPGNPSIIDTYATVLMATGARERALNLLSQAHQQAPQNPTLHYRYAAALAQAGQAEASTKELKALLANKAGFAKRAEAEALLKKLQTP
jgi:putative PEP-CTERM system TPR-repeat lipoprotein